MGLDLQAPSATILVMEQVVGIGQIGDFHINRIELKCNIGSLILDCYIGQAA